MLNGSLSTSEINLTFRNALSDACNSSRLGKWIYSRDFSDTLATARTFSPPTRGYEYGALQAAPRRSAEGHEFQ